MIGVIQKVRSLRRGEGGGGVSFKSEQKRTERDGVTCEYVRF